MGVTVRIPTPLQKYTGNKADVEVSGGTIGELIDSLEIQHPGMKERLIDEMGAVRRFVNFLPTETSVGYQSGADLGIHRA